MPLIYIYTLPNTSVYIYASLSYVMHGSLPAVFAIFVIFTPTVQRPPIDELCCLIIRNLFSVSFQQRLTSRESLCHRLYLPITIVKCNAFKYMINIYAYIYYIQFVVLIQSFIVPKESLEFV